MNEKKTKQPEIRIYVGKNRRGAIAATFAILLTIYNLTLVVIEKRDEYSNRFKQYPTYGLAATNVSSEWTQKKSVTDGRADVFPVRGVRTPVKETSKEKNE